MINNIFAADDAAYEMPLAEAASRARRYLSTIRARGAEVTPEAIAALAAFDTDLPEKGEDPVSIVRMLDEVGSPATVASMGGRFFGGVVGGAFPASVAAHWLADAWDQNACLYEFSPVAAHLEDVATRWILKLLQLPADSGSAFVTGTQMADVTALAAARHYLLEKMGWNVEDDGLFGAPPINVIVGQEVHATMLKALALLGLGRSRVTIVPADDQGRMIPSLIPHLSGPTIICAQAGNVNSGACDPLDEICNAAQRMNAWVHVDGAFGLWAAASTQHRSLVAAASRADSWAIDAHKWLNVSYDCGITFVRQSEVLSRSMGINASYYPGDHVKDRQPMQIGPESSRRARGVEVWATLRSLGTNGVSQLIERSCRHAQRFADGLRSAGFDILNDVVLNQVAVALDNDEATDALLEALRIDGTCWLRGATWKGRKIIRISVSSWATTEEDVDLCIATMVRLKTATTAGTTLLSGR